MRKSIIYGFLTILGIGISITGLIFQLSINMPLNEKQRIVITYDNNSKLFCNYYPNSKSIFSFGVIIFHGFAEDQNTMNGYVYAFLQAGFQVLTVDLVGHGRSTGKFSFDNSTDETQANHVLLIKEEFKKISGFNDSQLVLLGHSFGARAILRAATLDTQQVRGLILIGGLINSEGGYFPENDWIQTLCPANPSTNVSLITGSLDDVLTPDDAKKVFKLLANQTYSEEESYFLNSEKNYVKLEVVNGLFHTYEPISPSCIAYSVEGSLFFCGEAIDAENTRAINTKQSFRISTWMFIPAGLFLLVIFGLLWLDQTKWGFPTKQQILVYSPEEEIDDEENAIKLIRLVNVKKFLWYKIPIWFGAIAIGGAIALIFLVIPIGVPIFTLVYACPLTGYGIIMLILFGIGKMPGLEGKWYPRVSLLKPLLDWKKQLLTILVVSIINTLFAYYIDITWNNVLTSNIRLLWLFLLTAFATLGFYVKRQESNVIRRARPGNYGLLVLNNIIFLTPFLLLMIVLAAAGVYFIFVDSLHGFLIFSLVVYTGGLIQIFSRNTFISACIQSFMLILLALPRTPLMEIF